MGISRNGVIWPIGSSHSHCSSDSTVASGGRNSSAFADPESSLVEDFFEELDEEASGVDGSVAGKQSNLSERLLLD